MIDDKKASRTVRFFANLKHTKGKFYGKPFVPLPWQERIIRDVYGTVRDDGTRQYRFVYLEVPKKNGKSELVAGTALFHLFADGERNGEIYGCASDRSQAKIVFDVAVHMIDQAPALKKRAKLTASQNVIEDKVTGSVYKVVSAEAYTKHGLNPSAVVFDELHAQPNRALWDVMTFGAGDARVQPIWWVITTAGDDPDRVSIGWEQHEYAQRIIAGDVVDPTWYPVIYSYDGDDIFSEASWAQANPSLGETIAVESVREAADKAKVKPAEEKLFRWLRLNQWLTTKLTSWLPLDVFDATVGSWKRADLAGRRCYIGQDLSSTTDLTALAFIFPPQGDQADWRVIWECFIPRESMKERIARDKVPYDRWAAAGWITVTEGDVVDYTAIEQAMLDAKQKYTVLEVGSDPAMATMLTQRLQQAGLECVSVPQTFAVMTDPINNTEIFLKGGQLTHEDNPVARWCFGNASLAVNGSGLKKFVKESRGKTVIRTKRIDLVVALITGMARAKSFATAGSVYESRGLLVFG